MIKTLKDGLSFSYFTWFYSHSAHDAYILVGPHFTTFCTLAVINISLCRFGWSRRYNWEKIPILYRVPRFTWIKQVRLWHMSTVPYGGLTEPLGRWYLNASTLGGRKQNYFPHLKSQWNLSLHKKQNTTVWQMTKISWAIVRLSSASPYSVSGPETVGHIFFLIFFRREREACHCRYH